MLFNSWDFILVFLPGAFAGFFLLGMARRNALALIWLVAASLAFYSWWELRFLAVLLVSIVFNFVIGAQLGRGARAGATSRSLLVAGIAGNLALLGYFKYTGFVAGNLNALFGWNLQVPALVLPLGISFFTFQQIAYLVDAADGKTKEYDLPRYSLFVSFFPQLIAGPIVHHRELMTQFVRKNAFRPDATMISLGIGMFVVGLAKKVLIADSLAPTANAVFDSAQQGATLAAADAWIGALAYTFQLYFDFSGYSDMAIGLGLLFGIRLPLNFNSPYKAVNIVDFWRRWHMTLSRFLRDYIYVPLGGNRMGPWRRYANLMLTMLLGGLWHGAGWTFVLWGGFHGACIVACHAWHAMKGALGLSGPTRVGLWIARAFTFLVLVLGWVLFRAADIGSAVSILTAMTGANGLASSLPNHPLSGLDGTAILVTLTAIVMASPNSHEWMGYDPDPAAPARVWSGIAAQPIHAALLGCVFVFTLTQMSAVRVFLYFQF